MTKPSKSRCAWCGGAIEVASGPGRLRRYCRRSHRQRHYESRGLAEQRGLSQDELLFERSKVDQLHDLLYILETVCEDAAADLVSASNLKDARTIITHVLAAAAPLRDAYLEPKADLAG